MSEGLSPYRAPSRMPATPFRPDGGFRPEGLLALFGGLSLLAGLLGYLVGWAAQWFYLVLLFPIVIGAVIGAVGAKIVKWGKVRSPLLGGLAGLVGGIASAAAMQYHDYRAFQAARDEALTPELRELLKDPRFMAMAEADPEAAPMLEILAVGGFLDYIDFAAKQGVSISRASSSSDKGLNLGYVGTYIYWLIELGIVAGLAFIISKEAASEPFCTKCERWKPASVLGGLTPPGTGAAQALLAGEIDQLRTLGPHPVAGELAVSMYACPSCDSASTVEVKLDHNTRNDKGEVISKTLAHASYPGDARSIFEGMFRG